MVRPFGRVPGFQPFNHMVRRFLLIDHTGVAQILKPQVQTGIEEPRKRDVLRAAAPKPSPELTTKLKYQLHVAICLERPPVISAERTAPEEEFMRFLRAQELENSLLSDHEIEKFQDAKKAKVKKDIETLADEEIVIETAQDREDKWSEQFENFKPAERITEADKTNDQKSLNRKLDRKLYLAVNQSLGAPHWVFPQGPWEQGESLRQSAERVFRQKCGSQLNYTFLGNVPVGFYRYKYPTSSDIGKQFCGGKVFFFKALLSKGNIADQAKDIVDFRWNTREELKTIFFDKYFERVERFLYEFQPCLLSKDPTHEELVGMRF